MLDKKTDKTDQEIEGNFNIAETLRELFFPYWPLFLLSMLFAACIGFVYLKFTNPTYQVQAKILVKDNRKLGMASNDEVLEQLNLFSGNKVIENELEIIKSRLILNDVSKTLNNRVKWYRERRTLDVLMDFDFPVKMIPLFDEPFQGTNPMVATFDLSNRTMYLDNQAIPLEDSSFISLGNRQTFLLKVNFSRLEKWKKNTFDVNIINSDVAVAEIIGSLKVAANNKQNSIIDLSVVSSNHRRALTTLDQIISTYSASSIDDKKQLAQNTLDFIEDRLYLLTLQLDSVEKDVEIFKTKNHIVNLSEQSRLFLESVKSQDQRLSEIKIKLSVLDELDSYLRGKGNNPGTVPSLINFEDPILSNLLNKLYEMELQLQRSRRTLGQKDQTILSIEEDIASLKASILENTINLRSNLLASERDLNADLAEKLKELDQTPSKERALIEISRQQEIKNEIYAFLLQKREEAAISLASTIADIRILEYAQGSASPISPKKNQVYLISLILGFILPLFGIYSREHFNKKIQFTKELERRTDISVIAELRFEEKDNDDEILISEKGRSHIAESIRSIRTKLSYFMAMNNDNTAIFIGSSIAGEGKTFLTVNLARSFSLMGKKTVILGADLRKPRLSNIFATETKTGLSNYLAGFSGIDEIVYKTGFDNLSFIPSGPIPPNPSELLNNPRLEELIDQLKAQFDIVLIDTAPIGLVTDSDILAAHSDINIFVVRHNYTPKSVFDVVIGKLDRKLYRNSVIVFNGIKPRGMSSFGRDSYGYGYGYGYGYSYGYGDTYGEYAEDELPKTKTVKKEYFSFFKNPFKKKKK